MGIFKRFGQRARSQSLEQARPEPDGVQVAATLYDGDETLEVVGESNYQDALWAAVGGWRDEHVREDVIAVLVPEPENPYDSNAISVHITGHGIVGYLSRADAVRYLPGVRRLMEEHSTYVALHAVAVGGYIDGGEASGMLGIFLDHDPADFGVRDLPAFHRGDDTGHLDTGFSEAWRRDLDDDGYDLAWAENLPDADRPAIARLRELLTVETSPMSRHFMFLELEKRLYHSRDLYESALDEFDTCCAEHDGEMDVIRCECVDRWGLVPRLPTYRQMAVRLSKARDWDGVIRWTEHGLALYGDAPARDEAVEDLQKRLNRARAKLAEPPPRPRPPRIVEPRSTVSAESTSTTKFEVLVCARCAESFERPIQRGRKPMLCPSCRSAS